MRLILFNYKCIECGEEILEGSFAYQDGNKGMHLACGRKAARKAKARLPRPQKVRHAVPMALTIHSVRISERKYAATVFDHACFGHTREEAISKVLCPTIGKGLK